MIPDYEAFKCLTGSHYFKPYKEGTVKCERCGILAKVGYMTYGIYNRKNNTNDNSRGNKK